MDRGFFYRLLRHLFNQKQGLSFFILLIITIICASDKPWVLQRPSLTARAFRTVTFVTPSTGWAGGRRCLFRSLDSGKTWHEQQDPNDGFVTSFFFHDTLNGWATGFSGYEGGYFLHTSNGGELWEHRSIYTTPNKIHFLNRAKGWMIRNGKENNLYTTTDSGRTWTPQTLPWNSLEEGNDYYNVNDIQFMNDSVGIVVCNYAVFRTSDGGTTWTGSDSGTFSEAMFQLIKIAMVDEHTGYLLATGGIAKTTDGGLSWNEQLSCESAGHPGPFECLNSLGSDTVYAFYGRNPVSVAKTYNGGDTWSLSVSNIEQTVTEVSRTAWNNAIAVGGNGAVYSIFGAMDSLREVTSGTGADLGCIDFHASRYGCIGKKWDAGTVLLTDDGGESWYEKKIYLDTLQPQLTNVLRFDAATIYGGGSGGGGSNYLNAVSLDTGNTWMDINCSGSNDGLLNVRKLPHTPYGAYVINTHYELLVTEDIRTGQWEKRTYGGTWESPLFFYNKDTAWLKLGSDVLFTRDGAKTWDTICTACIQDEEGFNTHNGGIFFINSNVGWIGGIKGIPDDRKALFFRTDDGGRSFTRQEYVKLLIDPAIPMPRMLTGILKIRAVTESEAWALDENGLLHTSDGGDTWFESSLPQMPVDLNDIYCDTENRWVVGQGGGVWRQDEDAGIAEPFREHPPVSQAAGITNITLNNGILAFYLASPERITLRITTIGGRTLSDITVSAKAGRNIVRINNIRAAAGVYCYSLSLDDGNATVNGRFVLHET